MKYHYKKTNTICFDSADLEQLFAIEGRVKIAREILKRGYSTKDLLVDENKIYEITNTVKLVEDKEDTEVFAALYCLLEFYPTAKICFLLKDGIDPQKESISSLVKLKTSLKENNLTDFGLMMNDGPINFQLKQYRGTTTSSELFSFIKEKLQHYGNNLGDTNLLIVLQSKGDIRGSFFQDINSNLKTLNIKGGGHVLVLYNEENKWNVINTVYPILGTTRIPFRLPSNRRN